MTESFRQKFPPPWEVEQTSGGFTVKDSRGVRLLYVYAHDESVRSRTDGWDKLSWGQAQTLAKAVAALGNVD